MQSFDGRSLTARVRFANDCDAPWPCVTDCASGLDFDTCTEGLTDDGDGYCSSVCASKCLSSYKFSVMSIAQKEQLAFVCGFDGPAVVLAMRIMMRLVRKVGRALVMSALARQHMRAIATLVSKRKG